jgi:hypothetical protein
MERFELRAPIMAQLRSILDDYPGGQMLLEGLQNAEDSGATRFEIYLDLRCHDISNIREKGLMKYYGPAFVLVDNGRGFDDNNWKSLQNLNQSGKRNSPADIGRFGMGSRLARFML